ncbi:MAG: hypothetical protein AABY55_06115 [Candidatus Omnitrophota bacterium]
MLKSKIYKNSPVFIQNSLLTARGFMYKVLRESGAFRSMLSELEQTQHYTDSEMQEWQNERLVRLVRHAYENVPYYNRLFKKMKLLPGDIKNAEDLKKLPFLTKEDVRVNINDITAKNIKKAFVEKTSTSGSSGKPLTLYRDIYSVVFENALLWRQRRWIGVDMTDRIAVLRSEQIVPFEAEKPPFWRYSVSEKRLLLSSYHLRRNNAEYYIEALNRFKPAAIFAIPGVIYALAKLAEEEGLLPFIFSVKAVFTSSDMIRPGYKETIERTFGGAIYDLYGSTERAAAIGMCEYKTYHVFPENGIIEFVPVSNGSGAMEIVGTNLHNYVMPLLRYRTGDLAEISSTPCRCGRCFTAVKKMQGRIADFMVSRSGVILMEGSYLLLKGVENIVESQIIQEDIERIKVKFIPADNFSERDRNKIIENAKFYLGPGVHVVFEEVEDIRKQGFCKFRPFISHINNIR